MILTSMPDLPPRPATAANAEFRRMFYARWGRENTIVCGRSSEAVYATHTQTLSIKTAWGGRERYFLREREIAVDDDHWLVLNEGRAYGSELKSLRPTFSFSIFFRPGLQQEVAAALALPLEHALEEPDPAPRELQFAEHLRRHGDAVSRRLRALHGFTPYAYLLRKRAAVARRLLALAEGDREAIAQQCGFGSRFALARALRRFPGDA